MSNTKIYLGADVAKHTIQYCLLGENFILPNTLQGHRQLLKRIGSIKQPLQVICEATGGYERGVVDGLRSAGFTVLVLQPLQVKAYARLHLRRAKNDRLDAVLCLVQAAWASTRPQHGLPSNIDPLEGWIVSAPPASPH